MRGGAIKQLVIDASIAVAWGFADETTRFSERVLNLVSRAAEAFVPALWPFELANALLSAERRKRITAAQAASFLSRIAALSVTIDPPRISRAADQILSIARQHSLTVYDAAYLELAVRRGLPLATLDDPLRRAAAASGVTLIS